MTEKTEKGSILKGKRERYHEVGLIPVKATKTICDVYAGVKLLFLDPIINQTVDVYKKVTDFDYKEFLQRYLTESMEINE